MFNIIFKNKYETWMNRLNIDTARKGRNMMQQAINALPCTSRI